MQVWVSVDPLSHLYPSLSSYTYCSNNPLNKIDPTGMSDDWVQNLSTGKYEWKDNVTSSDNTPKGYKYVGANDSDILNDLNINTNTPNQTAVKMGGGLVGGDKLGEGGVAGGRTDLIGTLDVSAKVSYNDVNKTGNNSMGKTFDGVLFDAFLIQGQAGSSEDAKLNYKGSLMVSINGNPTYSNFGAPTTSTCIASGTSIQQASLFIPATNIARNTSFQSATISAGALNPGLLYTSPPLKMTWNLMKHTVIRRQ